MGIVEDISPDKQIVKARRYRCSRIPVGSSRVLAGGKAQQLGAIVSQGRENKIARRSTASISFESLQEEQHQHQLDLP